MIGIEEVLLKERPDWVLVYGDTNSTLAAALAAVKLHIPVCHVEAGTRTHSRTNPEEINRICTDHVSSLLLASTESGMTEMKVEGLAKNAIMVGDPMYDAFLQYSQQLQRTDIRLKDFDGRIISVPENYYYLTCHREENTNDDANLTEIMNAMEQLDAPTIYPVHPRNKERAKKIRDKYRYTNIIICEPVGYLESTSLVRGAKKIVTDSGGLQREAFFAEKKCVTVLDFVLWPETMVHNRNELSKPVASDILEKLHHKQIVKKDYQPFGDGHSAEKIVSALAKCHIER